MKSGMLLGNSSLLFVEESVKPVAKLPVCKSIIYTIDVVQWLGNMIVMKSWYYAKIATRKYME